MSPPVSWTLATVLLSAVEGAKILCLHGGGGSGAGFASQDGMASLVQDLGPNFEFVFIDAPHDFTGGFGWIRDPPGGKNEPTTDSDWAAASVAPASRSRSSRTRRRP